MLLLLVSVISQSEPPVPADEELRRARNEYAYGNYEEAIQRLRGVLYPMRLKTDEQVVEARHHLALALYHVGQSDEVRQEFSKLLFLAPEHQLDPYTIAPPIIEVFEQIRQSLAPQLAAIRQRQLDEQQAVAVPPPAPRIVEYRIYKNSELGTLLPFGYGQFQNSQTKWGVGFFLAQAALLATNIGSYAALARIGNYAPEHAATVRALTTAQFASLALFGMAWSAAVFHARLHFVPERVEERTVPSG